MKIFLCGDVMTGRGIDQIMPHRCDPVLHEPYIRSARDYVTLAERRSGPVPYPVGFDYVWGDALRQIDRQAPDLRIINLETSITSDGVPDIKQIHYRMHPGNVGCIMAARIDCCVLANNHVADWGLDGLAGTVGILADAGIASAGAGIDADAAGGPAILRGPQGSRTLVFAYGCPSAGVPRHWAAGKKQPGVNYLPDLDDAAVERVIGSIRTQRQAGDLVVVSIHWGPNWGYHVPAEHRSFARALIDAGVSIIHGHSSHHPIGIEVYRGKTILYGCGDLINDYEGIGGHESFRPDLSLAYFLDIDDGDHRLVSLEMVPFQSRKLQLRRASQVDAAWIADRLDRESRVTGARVRVSGDGVLSCTSTRIGPSDADPSPRKSKA